MVAEKKCGDTGFSNEINCKKNIQFRSTPKISFTLPSQQTNIFFLKYIALPPQRYADTYSLHWWHPTSSPTCRKCWNAAWRLISSSISQPANNNFSLSTPFVNSPPPFCDRGPCWEDFWGQWHPLGWDFHSKLIQCAIFCQRLWYSFQLDWKCGNK